MEEVQAKKTEASGNGDIDFKDFIIAVNTIDICQIYVILMHQGR